MAKSIIYPTVQLFEEDFTAKKAREIAQNNNLQLNEILKYIFLEAEKGKMSLNIEAVITNETIDALHKKGFMVASGASIDLHEIRW